jgi:peptide subunit release factor RF-3
MDREGKDAFDPMDEVEQKLDCYPLSFPIGGMQMIFKFIIFGNKTSTCLVETIVKHRRNNCLS